MQAPSFFSQTQSISLIILGIITFTSTVLKVISCLKSYDVSSRSGVIQVLENFLYKIMKDEQMKDSDPD